MYYMPDCIAGNITENQTQYTKLSYSNLELDGICPLSLGEEDT